MTDLEKEVMDLRDKLEAKEREVEKLETELMNEREAWAREEEGHIADKQDFEKKLSERERECEQAWTGHEKQVRSMAGQLRRVCDERDQARRSLAEMEKEKDAMCDLALACDKDKTQKALLVRAEKAKSRLSEAVKIAVLGMKLARHLGCLEPDESGCSGECATCEIMDAGQANPDISAAMDKEGSKDAQT